MRLALHGDAAPTHAAGLHCVAARLHNREHAYSLGEDGQQDQIQALVTMQARMHVLCYPPWQGHNAVQRVHQSCTPLQTGKSGSADRMLRVLECMHFQMHPCIQLSAPSTKRRWSDICWLVAAGCAGAWCWRSPAAQHASLHLADSAIMASYPYLVESSSSRGLRMIQQFLSNLNTPHFKTSRRRAKQLLTVAVGPGGTQPPACHPH